jgi:deazaflavin-dependent oxidoreductase (nitroreductase family)
MYNIMNGDQDQSNKEIRRFKFWNKWFVVPLYRINLLPLFGAGFFFLLIYHVGRKSGRQYITPVEYRKKDGDVILFASRGLRTDWYRNMIASPDQVRVKIGFRKYTPEVKPVQDKKEKIDLMTWYITKFPKAAKMLFGWDPKKDDLTDDLLLPLSDYIAIIKLEL